MLVPLIRSSLLPLARYTPINITTHSRFWNLSMQSNNVCKRVPRERNVGLPPTWGNSFFRWALLCHYSNISLYFILRQREKQQPLQQARKTFYGHDLSKYLGLENTLSSMFSKDISLSNPWMCNYLQLFLKIEQKINMTWTHGLNNINLFPLKLFSKAI